MKQLHNLKALEDSYHESKKSNCHIVQTIPLFQRKST